MNLDPDKLRAKVLKMVYQKKSGHIGGAFSMAELTSVLYSNYDIGNSDKLILSKGHAVPIIYAALHELGKLSDEDLDLFREIDSPLQGHPDKVALPLMDATTGSLGQGLSIAIGHGIAKKMKKEKGLVFCVLGDGEVQEGQIWEALMYAAKIKLDNLVCFVDWNKSQNDGSLEDFSYENLQGKIRLFGWDCDIVDGHDMEEIQKSIYCHSKPRCVILDTVKSKGVSFMENNPSWHCKVPTEDGDDYYYDEDADPVEQDAARRKVSRRTVDPDGPEADKHGSRR